MIEYAPFIEQFSYPGLFLLLILGSLGFPFPEDAILLFSGYLICTDVLNPVSVALVAYVGVLASDFIIYSMGRRYGRRVVTHPRFHRLLSPERLASLESKFQRCGNILIFLGRHLWGLRSQIFLTAGIMGIPPKKFLLIDALAALITVPVMMTLGCASSQKLKHISLDMVRLGPVLPVACALLILLLIFRHAVKRRRKNDMELPEGAGQG